MIFDLDGLLLDTESNFIAAWQQALQQMGYPVSLQVTPLLGEAGHVIVAALLAHYGTDFDLKRFQQLSTENWLTRIRRHPIPVKPGVTEWLDYARMHHIKIAIATNSPYLAALACLKSAGLAECFPLMITPEQVLQPKPDPEIYISAIQQLGLRGQDCLAFEDSLTGVRAATSAGLTTLYIPSRLPADKQALRLSPICFNSLKEAYIQLS